ncbi:hypothetical protein VTN96DRAFT_7234 [Rasamsonia emersonii]
MIIAKKTIGTIVKNGQLITLSAATRTTHWMRPEIAVDAMKDSFAQAVEGYTGDSPEDTREICAREPDHPGPSDSRDHFTGVCFNSKGEGKSVHFPVKK